VTVSETVVNWLFVTVLLEPFSLVKVVVSENVLVDLKKSGNWISIDSLTPIAIDAEAKRKDEFRVQFACSSDR
jgi:hypothetical protein